MRLIDADFFNNFDYSCFDGRLSEDAIQGMNTVLDLIDKSPTIDAYPVRHGRWVQVICHEEFEDGFVDRVKECCSVCHAPNGRKTTNYCPHCGAKMDEVMNNENK